jgi:probable O-glycosylation ligase (exosortase A-associated)
VRDIVLSLIIAGLIPMSLRNPRIGVCAWAWLSIMNPHKLTYGFAHSMPWALMIAAATLVGFLVTKERKVLPLNAVTTLYGALMLWMTVTTFFALGSPEYVWDRWLFVFKIHLMTFLTLMVIRGRQHIEVLMWVVVGSLGFYGLKGGLWTILSGGGGRVWGAPGGMTEGNNELAVALVMITPLVYYFHQTVRKRWLKPALAVSLGVIAFAVLGTQSRGALLSLLAMAMALGLKGKNPVRTSLLVTLGVAVAVGFMPESWTSRMDTIQEYKADSSAMSRIWTWQTLWNLAVDRPIVGGGFGTDIPVIFAKYAPATDEWAHFSGRVFVAHSIYLQALGEHGFPGLVMYVLLGLFSWRLAAKVAGEARSDPELQAWVPLLMRMCQASLLGFSVGGSFLTLVHFDVPYYVVALIVLTGATVREKRKSAEVSGPQSVSLPTLKTAPP